MTCYCTLHINSKDRSQLPPDLFLARALRQFDFTDNESPDRKARRDRLLAKGILQRVDLPRYWWQVDTDGRVSGSEVADHLRWLTSQLKRGRLLTELNELGYSYWVSVFWGGNGSGGGPLITREALSLLHLHGVELGIGFYHQEQKPPLISRGF